MKGYDAEGQLGPKKPLPDAVQIFDPPIDKVVSEPSSEQKEPLVVAAPPVEDQTAYPVQDTYQTDGYEQPVF
jgi:small subunit ribosomal protein S3e